MKDNRCNCESCGTVIWEHESRFIDSDNTFCSPECRDTYAFENRPVVKFFHPELDLNDPNRQLQLNLA